MFTEPPTITPVSLMPVGWREAIAAIESAELTPVLCTTCQWPGAVVATDGRGWLIAHPGRQFFPCRVFRVEDGAAA
jgi:hypothetical protein